MTIRLRLLLILLAVVGFCALFLQLERRPGVFANSTYLGAVLLLEVVVVCLSRFERVFFPVTMGCFLLAATSLPGAGESLTVRWVFLGVGALVGFIVWMRSSHARHFGLFHLVGLFCV